MKKKKRALEVKYSYLGWAGNRDYEYSTSTGMYVWDLPDVQVQVQELASYHSRDWTWTGPGGSGGRDDRPSSRVHPQRRLLRRIIRVQVELSHTVYMILTVANKLTYNLPSFISLQWYV